MKVLLAFTTYNQIEYTKKLVGCLKKINMPNLDVIFIDDVSKDGTQKFLKELDRRILLLKERKNLYLYIRNKLNLSNEEVTKDEITILINKYKQEKKNFIRKL